MRYHQIKPPSDDWDELQKIIDTKCTNLSGGYVPLYRGTHGKPNNFLGTIRTDRKPRDADPSEVKLFDAYMRAHNLPHRKANTLSVSLHTGQAAIFGREIYQIYPFDDAYYVGSTKFRDFQGIPRVLAKELMYRADLIWSNIADIIDDEIRLVELIQRYLKELDEATGLFSTKDPKQLTNAAGEIIIYGSQYVALRI